MDVASSEDGDYVRILQHGLEYQTNAASSVLLSMRFAKFDAYLSENDSKISGTRDADANIAADPRFSGQVVVLDVVGHSAHTRCFNPALDLLHDTIVYRNQGRWGTSDTMEVVPWTA